MDMKLKTRYDAYPRIQIDREIWNIFKHHCIEKNIKTSYALRILVIRYLKHNKLIGDEVKEDAPSIKYYTGEGGMDKTDNSKTENYINKQGANNG